MASFESFGTVSYSPSIVTMASISYHFGDKARYRPKIAIFSYPLAFDAPVGGSPSDYCHIIWCGSRMVWLPDDEKSPMICLAVSTEYRRVTDGRTDRHLVDSSSRQVINIQAIYAPGSIFIHDWTQTIDTSLAALITSPTCISENNLRRDASNYTLIATWRIQWVSEEAQRPSPSLSWLIGGSLRERCQRFCCILCRPIIRDRRSH